MNAQQRRKAKRVVKGVKAEFKKRLQAPNEEKKAVKLPDPDATPKL